MAVALQDALDDNAPELFTVEWAPPPQSSLFVEGFEDAEPATVPQNRTE